jgi:hypothetical protein
VEEKINTYRQAPKISNILIGLKYIQVQRISSMPEEN